MTRPGPGQAPGPAYAGAANNRLNDALIARHLDRVAVRVVEIDRLDRADRAGPGPLHPDRQPARLDMRRDLGDRRLGDEADMRRLPLLAACRHRAAGQVEMD